MWLVFQWLRDDGTVTHETALYSAEKRYDWKRLAHQAHRVYADGRKFKDNCGECPAALPKG